MMHRLKIQNSIRETERKRDLAHKNKKISFNVTIHSIKDTCQTTKATK